MRLGDAGEFEGDDGTHAVAEQRQRCDAGPWCGLEEAGGQVVHAFVCGLAEAVGPLWILHDVGVATGGQRRRQHPIARGGRTGMRKYHRGARTAVRRPVVAAPGQLDPGRERGRHGDQIIQCHCTVYDFAGC